VGSLFFYVSYPQVGQALKISIVCDFGIDGLASRQRRCLWNPRAFEKARPKLLLSLSNQQ